MGNNSKVWFVTGASKGLGLALVKRLLAEGQRVAATSRKADALIRAVDATGIARDGGSVAATTTGPVEVAGLVEVARPVEAVGLVEATGPVETTRPVEAVESFLPLETDLGSERSVEASVRAAVQRFGRIDVVVNNAGYGIGGAIEELTEAEIEASFEVNVFATLRVIRKVMPYLRAQRSGHIINISSIAGFAGNTGWAVYVAAKHAVTGLSDVLAQDVRSLGIKVTTVSPGAFRTDFLSAGSLVITGNRIEDYADVHASHARYLEMDGRQIGDPDKAAEVIIRLTEMPEPPVNLYLGSDAYERASAKLGKIGAELEQWKEISISTQFES